MRVHGLATCCGCLISVSAAACPPIGGLVDVNCDGRLKIAVTGDSIVAGVRDTARPKGGGYVARLGESLPFASVQNIGVPGIFSKKLLRSFKKLLPKVPPGAIRRRSAMADIFIIDVGRNDYWMREPPAMTVRNIRRLVRYLREELVALDGSPPVVLVAMLTPTTRGYQQWFIASVNALLTRYRSGTLPAYLRFDRIDPALISFDGIHPTSRGYAAMTRIALRYLIGPAQMQCSKLQRRIFPSSM